MTVITWYSCSTSGVVSDPANNASGGTKVVFVLPSNQSQLIVTKPNGWQPRCKNGTGLRLQDFSYANDYKPFDGYTATPIPPTATSTPISPTITPVPPTATRIATNTPSPPTATRGPLPTNPPFNTPTPGSPPPTASCGCPPGQVCTNVACTTLAVRPPLEAVLRKEEQH